MSDGQFEFAEDGSQNVASDESRPSDRQSELEELLERSSWEPGVAEAMEFWKRIHSLSPRPIPYRSKHLVRYSTATRLRGTPIAHVG